MLHALRNAANVLACTPTDDVPFFSHCEMLAAVTPIREANTVWVSPSTSRHERMASPVSGSGKGGDSFAEFLFKSALTERGLFTTGFVFSAVASALTLRAVASLFGVPVGFLAGFSGYAFSGENEVPTEIAEDTFRILFQSLHVVSVDLIGHLFAGVSFPCLRQCIGNTTRKDYQKYFLDR